MVVEEKFVSGKDIHPLQAVGWEGNVLVVHILELAVVAQNMSLCLVGTDQCEEQV